jgi:hypothetical protein
MSTEPNEYPVDLSLFRVYTPEEHDDSIPVYEFGEQDPQDGRAELRRQAHMVEIDPPDDRERHYIYNPMTTIAVAAACLGISERQYHRLVDAGHLPQFPKGHVDLEIVFDDFMRYQGLEVDKVNPRTNVRYRYNRRRKVY